MSMRASIISGLCLGAVWMAGAALIFGKTWGYSAINGLAVFCGWMMPDIIRAIERRFGCKE